MAGTPKKTATIKALEENVQRAKKGLPTVDADSPYLTDFVDMTGLEPAEFLPCKRPLDELNWVEIARRGRMDQVLRGIIADGLQAMAGIALELAVIHGDSRGYAVTTVQAWMDEDVDEFKQRAKVANDVFKSRLSMAIVRRASNLKTNQAQTLLLAVNNAYNSEHFQYQKSAATLRDSAEDGFDPFLKNLVAAGANAKAEREQRQDNGSE